MHVAALVSALVPWIDRLFPDPERAGRLRQALEERFGDDAREAGEAECREIERTARAFSRHFTLKFEPAGTLVPDAEPPGWPPQDPAEVRARAGSVEEVRRLPDGVGVLRLSGLDAVEHAAPFLEAAFALLSGARSVILDLRANGGGDPATVALVLDWVLGGGSPRHISDVLYRDRTRQWWTPGRPAGRALDPGVRVAVLVGQGTYSSGEALAYHVQTRGRGPIVGEATPGAADHVTPVRVTPHVLAELPEARVRDAVSGGNWEGTGVVPDVACAVPEALDTALATLSEPPMRRPGCWSTRR